MHFASKLDHFTAWPANLLPYSWKIWLGIKFGGLAV